MAFYENLRDNTAGKLIEKRGMPVSLVDTTSSDVFDVDSGTITEGANVSHPAYGLFTEYKSSELYYGDVLRGDMKMLLSSKNLAVVPTTSMYIEAGGHEYAILDVFPLNPGGVDVMYTLQLRNNGE